MEKGPEVLSYRGYDIENASPRETWYCLYKLQFLRDIYCDILTGFTLIWFAVQAQRVKTSLRYRWNKLSRY